MLNLKESLCPICDGKAEYKEWNDERGIDEYLHVCKTCEWEYHYAYGQYFVTIKNNYWEMNDENKMMKALKEREIALICDMYKTVFYKKEKPKEDLYNQFLIITKMRVREEKQGYSTFDATGF